MKLASSSLSKPAATAATSDAVLRGYAAPFPEGADREQYLGAARAFPSFVPLFADGGIHGVPEDVQDNHAAWEVFKRWNKPFLTAFGDKVQIPAAKYAHPSMYS
jgi:haloalkane dehalogenase